MSKKLLVPANLPGMQLPEGYMLVQHINPTPNVASNSKVTVPKAKPFEHKRQETVYLSGIVDIAVSG